MAVTAPPLNIDLTLTGHTISTSTLARIDADLDDLLLPWVMDLSALASIRHPAPPAIPTWWMSRC